MGGVKVDSAWLSPGGIVLDLYSKKKEEQLRSNYIYIVKLTKRDNCILYYKKT